VLGGFAAAALSACGRKPPKPPDSCQGSCRRTPELPAVLAFDRGLEEYKRSPAAAAGRNNEAGELAWSQSYALLALMRVYQATRRSEYLDEVGQIGDNILAQTDRARGVTDYLGRSGPVWRSGGTYTASDALLTSATEAPVVQIRYAGSHSDLAAVTVTPGSRPTTFTLLLTHPQADPVRVINVSTAPEHARYVETTVLSEAYRPSAPWTASAIAPGVPTTGVKRLRAKYAVYAVSTGMISYPLALYARVVLKDSGLSRGPHRQRAERFVEAAREAVAFHNSEWSAPSPRVAGYVFAKGAPVPRDGNRLPFNQSNAVGQTLAELYRITRDRHYAEQVEALASAWRASLQPRSDGASVWSYWPPFSKVYTGYTAAEQVSVYNPEMPPTRYLDDLSHSAITTEFAVAALGARIGITEHDRTGLVQTYLGQLKSGAGSVRARFGGPVADNHDALQCTRWLGLGDKRIARHVLTVVDRLDPPATSGAGLLARGYLAWAAAGRLI
jgi:hypothetical protein